MDNKISATGRVYTVSILTYQNKTAVSLLRGAIVVLGLSRANIKFLPLRRIDVFDVCIDHGGIRRRRRLASSHNRLRIRHFWRRYVWVDKRLLGQRHTLALSLGLRYEVLCALGPLATSRACRCGRATFGDRWRKHRELERDEPWSASTMQGIRGKWR